MRDAEYRLKEGRDRRTGPKPEAAETAKGESERAPTAFPMLSSALGVQNPRCFSWNLRKASSTERRNLSTRLVAIATRQVTTARGK